MPEVPSSNLGVGNILSFFFIFCYLRYLLIQYLWFLNSYGSLRYINRKIMCNHIGGCKDTSTTGFHLKKPCVLDWRESLINHGF